jgi:hypothetical protein
MKINLLYGKHEMSGKGHLIEKIVEKRKQQQNNTYST